MAAHAGLKARFERGIQQIAEREYAYGYLGIQVDGAFVFAVPNKAGYVYCRVEAAPGLERAECLTRISLDPYTRCQFRRIGGTLVAVGFVDDDAARNYGADGRLLNVPGLPLPNRGAGDLTAAISDGTLFDLMLTDDDGNVLADDDGNVLTGE